MDWANESYVRLYCRDTSDLLAVGWEGRALFFELLRKADRAGVIDADRDVLAELVRMPHEVVERVLPRLIKRGCIEAHEGYFAIPNFDEAQSATKSDRQRQRELRERRKSAASLGHLKSRASNSTTENVTDESLSVTTPSRAVGEVDENVTAGHELSRARTPMLCSTVQYGAVQCDAGSRDSGESRPVTEGVSEPPETDDSDREPTDQTPPPKAKQPPPPPIALELADELREAIVTDSPGHELATRWTEAKRTAWARELDRMLRLDGRKSDGTKGRSPDQVRYAIRWLFGDQMGSDARFVVESPTALRKKFDRIAGQIRNQQRANQANASGDSIRAEAARLRAMGH